MANFAVGASARNNGTPVDDGDGLTMATVWRCGLAMWFGDVFGDVFGDGEGLMIAMDDGPPVSLTMSDNGSWL